jgi:hypothetical protein
MRSLPLNKMFRAAIALAMGLLASRPLAAAETTPPPSLGNIETALLAVIETYKAKPTDSDAPLQKFISALDLKLKVFQADATSKQASMGFSYNFGKEGAVNRVSLTDEKAEGRLMVAYGYTAEGNVAFDATRNPSDFLKSSTHVSWSKNYFLADNIDDTERSAAIRRAIALAAKDESEGALQDSPLWRQVQKEARNGLRDQLYLIAGGSAALESNQRFTQKNWAYGARVGIDFKAWRPDSHRALWNVVDYPFALLRSATGMEKDFRPDGTSFPTFLLRFDRIKPVDDKDRKAAGDENDFDRFSAEVAFKTPIAVIRGETAYFQVDYRRYQEIGASAAIKSKDLDHAEYVAFTLKMPKGLFVSYTTGKLPFDRESDQVYAAGWTYDLGK